jgi:hypothetical protein
VIDHEEYYELEPLEDGKKAVIEGSQTAFLHLRAPDGTIVRAEIPYAHLDKLLAMIIPDFYGTVELVVNSEAKSPDLERENDVEKPRREL